MPSYEISRRRARRLARLAFITEAMISVLEIKSYMERIQQQRSKHRSTHVRRQRRPWAVYVKPMLEDKTFKRRFRMEYDDFMDLVNMIRGDLQRDDEMGALRNGAVPVEYQVAMTLRWLAGASIFEGVDGHVVARSTAYAIAHRVIAAINACPALDCKWPTTDQGVAQAARGFEERSSGGVISKCVGAMDGLFVRTKCPTTADTPEPHKYYSGHKKGFGMNFQAVCDAKYKIIAWTMNGPGSQNDRKAFKCSGFQKLLRELPPGYFVLGDAAYPSSDRVLVPYRGNRLPPFQDAFNYYQSQSRMAIEQTFGILVRTWGILCRPLEIRVRRVARLMNCIVRLHNYCRSRNVAETDDNDGDPDVNAHAGLTRSGGITGTLYETNHVGTGGRPCDNQAGVSAPRENIRSKLEVLGMVRPAHNLARNMNATSR